ncbi:MAG TPA: DUF3105 domain-containing protein [Dehalococcoidia bacterium]|nr:DUF3105 domain-containing protein [Dehalococcoidia bacterium]
MGSGGGANWTLIGAVLGVAAIAGIIVYAVIQSTTGSSADEIPGFLKAIRDDSPNLPGQYIPPHPGADGKVCLEVSCLQNNDDRQHFGNGVVWGFCTPEQIAANQVNGCYTSNPPTSGPHAASPAQFKVLENPAPKENLIHSMEHGAVVVWYNTEDQDVIKQLAAWVQDHLDRRRLVVMTKYTEMEPNTIALTAWTRLDKFPVSELTKKRVDDFISAHNKRFNPEGF